MSLKPQNIVQAAEADIKRGVRNAQQAAESKQFAPCYEEYAFHRRHVRKAKSAHDLMVLALMEPTVPTKKANTKMIYGNAGLLVAAIRLSGQPHAQLADHADDDHDRAGAAEVRQFGGDAVTVPTGG